MFFFVFLIEDVYELMNKVTVTVIHLNKDPGGDLVS